jgi:predicted dinucleotide-binding enzyme
LFSYTSTEISMKIGIIGAGKMGSGLGKLWATQGHTVMFSYSRDRPKLEALALSVGENSSVGTPAEAAQFGEIVLLAIPWSAVAEALAAVGSWAGKPVISCVTPLKTDFSGLELGTTTSAAEEIAMQIAGAKVVEVLFPFAERLHADSRQFGAQTPTQFYCGDDAEAKAIAAQLIIDVGLTPVDAGALTSARYLEPVGMLLVNLAYGLGMGTDIGLQLLTQ